jgi:hypothetical protein
MNRISKTTAAPKRIEKSEPAGHSGKQIGKLKWRAGLQSS